MTDQTILLADDKGNFTGEYESKIVCHTGKGKHHLAISVFVYNSKGEILMQKRKHEVFDNIWDNTGATHQLHLESGKDETDEEATMRCLKVEWEINKVERMTNLGGFNYFAEYGKLCENEFCKLLIAEYNGEVKLNPDVGYDYKWMDKKEFLEDLKTNPEKYTPWCNAAIPLLTKNNYFDY